MRTLGFYWILLTAAISGTSLRAATTLTMEGAVQAALMGNRDLAAARFQVNEAQARLRGAGLLPNPDFEFAGMSDFAFGGQGEGAFTLGLTQRFPLTARLSADRQIGRLDVALALREIRNDERLLIARVQSLYVRIQAARLRERASDAARRSALDFTKLAAQRLTLGQGSLAEAGLSRVEERRWANAAATAATDAEALLIDLKTALGLPAGASLALSESLDALLARLRRNVPRHGSIDRPDADRAVLEIDRAQAEVRLARADAWEGIRVGVEYTYDHAVDEPSGLGTSEFLGLRVSIPLPVWNQNQGAIAAKKAGRERAEAQVRAIELDIENSIAIAARRASLYGAQWDAFRSGTEGAVTADERQLAEGFKQGRVDMRDLLQFQAQSATLRVDSVTLRENLALALVDWQAAVGGHPAVSQPYVGSKPTGETIPSKKP